MTIPTKTTKKKLRPLLKYDVDGVVHGVGRSTSYPVVGRRAVAVDNKNAPIFRMWALCGKIDSAGKNWNKVPADTEMTCIKCLALPNEWPLKLSAVICGNCQDVIYSRANHDFHYCTCGKVAVDGGPGVGRIIGAPWTACSVLVDASRAELYADWNTSKSKYGVIQKKNQKDVTP